MSTEARDPAGTAAPSAPEGFDVFLSHTRRDAALVERLAEKIKRAGLEPWLDTWCLVPGEDWQAGIASGLRCSSSCAVVVGPSDIGAWTQEEATVALDRAAADRGFRVFLLLLPGLPEPFDATTLSPFLRMRTWVDFRAGLDDPRALQALIAAVKGLPLGPAVPVEGAEATCPYRGLEVFDEQHAAFFFGRDAEIQRLLEHLKRTRFLAVLGASGSGKSSLVRAGLIPKLRDGALPGSERWLVCVLTPGARPLEALAARMVGLSDSGAMQPTLDGLRADPRTLHLAGTLAAANGHPAPRVVWVVDQFEEIFTLCRDPEARSAFIANLLYAASVPDGNGAVVLTMRADFYHRCLEHPELAQQLAAQQFAVSPIDETGLRQVIEEPARLVGLDLEPGLVATILDDVAAQPGALPLLEHALLELWERRAGTMLTLAGYRDSGGVRGAIAARADVVFAALSPEQQAIARRTLLRLTEPGEGTEDTRRRAELDELTTDAASAADVDTVVHRLAEARLLTLGTDRPDGEEWVDVAHEALIRGWPRLRTWIEEDRAGLRVHRRLTYAAEDWAQHDRDEGLLYRGPRLAEASVWLERHGDAPNALERAFVEASVALRDREAAEAERRRRAELEHAQQLAAVEAHSARKFRRLSGVLAAVVLLLVGTACVVLVLQRRAVDQRNRILPSQLAKQSDAVLAERPRLALLLALEARRAMRATGTHVDAVDAALRNAVGSTGGTVLARHRAEVTAVAPSADGAQVATGEADGTVQVIDVRSGAVRRVEASLDGPVGELRFTPDRRRLLVAHREFDTYDNADRFVRVVDLAPGGAPLREQKLPDLRGRLVIADLSHDGRWLAGRPAGGRLRLWDLEALRSVPLPGPPVTPIAPDFLSTVLGFTSDDRRLAAVDAGGGRGTVWSLAGGRASSPTRLPRAQQTLLYDGATKGLWAVGGGTAWNLERGRPRASARAVHGLGDTAPTLLASAPDGSWLAYVADGVLWLARGRQLQPLSNGELAFTALGVGEDTRWLVASGGAQDGLGERLQLWDTSSSRPRRVRLADRPGNTAVGSLRWAARADDTGIAEVFDLASDAAPPARFVVSGPKGPPSELAVTGDDRTLVMLTSGTLTATDLTAAAAGGATRGEPAVLRGHDGPIATGPRGDPKVFVGTHDVITAGTDHTTRLWRLPYRPETSGDLVALACRIAGRNLTEQEWKTYLPGRTHPRTCPAYPAG